MRSLNLASTPMEHSPVATPRIRTRLWDISAWMHCSIVGTCLTTTDLRQLLVKLGLATPSINDHDAHKIGVTIAGRHDTAERDASITDLRAALARRSATEAAASEPAPERGLKAQVADLEDRLGREATRRQWAEASLADARAELQRERAAHAVALQRAESIDCELQSLEHHLAQETEAAADLLSRLDGMQILYVRGRPALMAGLIARADIVLFPVDCVRHRAVGVIKSRCEKSDKPFAALRSASVSAFLAVLSRLGPEAAAPRSV